MLIVPFEQLEKNPGVLCNNICEFLGLPPYELGDTRPLNIAGEREVMESRCKGYLTEFFRPHNRRLFDFLGEDWGWPS